MKRRGLRKRYGHAGKRVEAKIDNFDPKRIYFQKGGKLMSVRRKGA